MSKVYIAGGLRTPIGKTGGFFKDILPEKLAAHVLNGVVSKYGLSPGDIDMVILGNASGPGGNIARVSILEAGWPYEIPGITVDFQCGSGLCSVSLASGQIFSGQADLVIAGGVESTSMAPKRQFNPRDPRFQGENIFYERAPFSPAFIGDPEMGEGAENVARLMNISRADMDSLALKSHFRAYNSQKEHILKDVIAPLNVEGKLIDKDECIRPDITLKLLERMPPAFVKNGRVTAGNSCLKHDGAAALLLCSEEALKKYGLIPAAVITGTASCGCDPNLFPLGPVYAVRKLISKCNIPLSHIDAFEINEAFAAKVIACCNELGIITEKTNILGGALAFGHPYGASGAIILLHLLKALEKVNGSKGIAAIGVAGGQGTAVFIERCK